MSFTAAGRTRTRCFAQPDLPHPTRTKPRDQAIAADGHGFVQLVLIDLEDRASAEENRAFQHRFSVRGCFRARCIASSRRIESGDTPSITFPSRRACRTHEMIDERRYVLAPLGERRHVEPVRNE